MRVLIIGGTGLISTAITQQLLARGDQVVHFNRGFTRQHGDPPTKVIRGNRNDEMALRAAFREVMPDATIDMMAFKPAQAQALLRVADGCTPQLVICSTVCVYGGRLTRLPADEREPHRPVGEYGRNKSEMESVIWGWEDARRHLTILRPSFTTGEGATASGLLFDDSTVNRLREGKPVVIMDDGKAAWAIAHVSDVAEAFVASLGNPRAFGKAYNVTSDEHLDWNGVFAALATAAGAKNPSFVHIPAEWLYRQAPRRSVAIEYIFKYPSIFDNTNAALDLGFRTKVKLLDTFRRQLKWMEENNMLRPTSEESVQDELVAAWQEDRPVSQKRFCDLNTWGNSITG